MLRDGESAIINPYEIHSVIAVSDAVEYFCITFSLSLLTAVQQHPANELCDKLLLGEVRFNNKSDSSEILRLMEEIERLFAEKNKGWELYLSADIFRIFAFLISTDQCIGVKSGRRRLFSRHVNEFIEENYRNHITSQDAALALSYDQSYFCRLFKSSFGKSFGDYLTFF
jgi:YesN/AraC family two-component response regulator